jgi:hypothetical protein
MYPELAEEQVALVIQRITEFETKHVEHRAVVM